MADHNETDLVFKRDQNEEGSLPSGWEIWISTFHGYEVRLTMSQVYIREIEVYGIPVPLERDVSEQSEWEDEDETEGGSYSVFHVFLPRNNLGLINPSALRVAASEVPPFLEPEEVGSLYWLGFFKWKMALDQNLSSLYVPDHINLNRPSLHTESAYNTALLHYESGKAYTSLRDYEAAKEYFDKATALFKDDCALLEAEEQHLNERIESARKKVADLQIEFLQSHNFSGSKIN